MLFFYDTKLTGGTIISIGVEAENGYTFYADSNECDTEKENDETLQHTRIFGSEKEIIIALNNWIHCTLNHSSDKQNKNSALFVSDRATYSSTILLDLLDLLAKSSVMNNIIPMVYDITHDIVKWILIDDEPITLTSTIMKEAIDMNREELLDNLIEAYIIYHYDYGPDDFDYDSKIVESVTKKFKPSKNTHDALYNAKVIHSLYILLNNEE